MLFSINFSMENETEEVVMCQMARQSGNPYQWVPTAKLMTNTLGFAVLYKNGTEYDISSTTEENEFEIWLDNKISPGDITFMKGLATFPPSLMQTFEVEVPKLSTLFVNVMHNLNITEYEINITNSSGDVIDVITASEILNSMYYLGKQIN